MTALAALTERVVLGTLRDLDLLFAILVPIVTVVGFNLALRHVIDTGGMSYIQYVLPAVVVQAMLIGTLATADRAGREKASGFGVRLQTLPIPSVVPLMARMLYCLFRGILALVSAIAAGYVLGFRMNGGFGYAAAFVIVALMLTLAMSLGADAVGTGVGRVETSSQFLLIPQLLLVLLSTGMAPVDSFSNWLQPFVRYQPVSLVTETLRGFSSGHVVGSSLVASLAWCSALLIVFGAIAIRMQRRTA